MHFTLKTDRQAGDYSVRTHLGFKGKDQLPLVMIWRVWAYKDKVYDGQVLFSTDNIWYKLKGMLS